MAVLITGGAGYIGSHTALALMDAGETVCVIDDLSTGLRESVPPGAHFEQGNVADKLFVHRVMKTFDVDAVIHFAGSIRVDESVSDPLKYFRNNTDASRRLIEATLEAGVRHFIFSSTAAVYGDPERLPVTEDGALRPLSPYGTSKLMTEMMLRDVSMSLPLRFTALRYFNVAGADPAGRAGQISPISTHLIKIACEAAVGKRSHVNIYGTDFDTPDGTAVRDYIHVSDLAIAHYLALQRLRAGGTSIAMNCGYGVGYSVLEVIEAVKAVSGVAFPAIPSERRPGDSPKVVADCRLIKNECDWRPRYNDLSTIVAHALKWEKLLWDAGRSLQHA
ncbi:UDP-glucose 4-epimerase GalE [Pararhizobium haloflavum]|uniref:UDP-glucose 4-epimerase GalE n=1 Tax=Pararhizobium haloflavum TaxID=2037914 RepID=UPI000C18488D|nr:UDP-glucose 4-epimerase GalE [Pararhizobium haloflavum]